MRKVALVLAALAAVAMTTSAEAAKKKAAAPKADPAAQSRQNTAKFFGDMFRGPRPAAAAQPAGKKGKKRA